MLTRILTILAFMLIGGIACWTPDVTLQLYRNYSFTGRDVLLVSVLMPTAVVGSYALLVNLRGKIGRRPSLALFMLLGMWLLGSTAMRIGATATGGGFSGGDASVWYVIAGLLPPYTCIMACYDGGILGLLLSSALLFMAHFFFELDHWIFPRRFMVWLRLPAP